MLYSPLDTHETKYLSLEPWLMFCKISSAPWLYSTAGSTGASEMQPLPHLLHRHLLGQTENGDPVPGVLCHSSWWVWSCVVFTRRDGNLPSERRDPLQVLHVQATWSFLLMFFFQIQSQGRGQITMELIEMEDNASLGSLSVNYTTSSIFNPWETCEMKR